MHFFRGLHEVKHYSAIIGTIIAAFLFVCSVTGASATTYTVNTTSDGDDATCTHPYVDASNDCTLHEAIDAANTNAGTDTITFDISTANFSDDGDGQFTITITSALPTISGAVDLTAASMWDSTGTVSNRPGIKLLGAGLGSGVDGLTVSAGSSEVKGLVIEDFPDTGIVLQTANSNIIGTDCDGTNDDKERNVIVRNNLIGISLVATSDSNIIAGNYIGIDSDGTTAAGNGDSGSTWGMSGILMKSDSNIIGYNSTSCTAAQQRNVIGGTGVNLNESTSSFNAIMIDQADYNRVSGNYLGTDATGNAAVPNVGASIYLVINSEYNTIGTNGDGVNDSSEGNVISGNKGHGIHVWGGAPYDAPGSGGPEHNRISGNWIGFAANGTHLPNGTAGQGRNGINVRMNYVIIGWCDTTIDATLCSDNGTLADQKNYIIGADGSTPSDGIRLGTRSDYVEIYGNSFGVSPTGQTIAAVSSAAIGVIRENTSHTIGGSGDNKKNDIANHNYGIQFSSSTGATTEPIQNIAVTNNNIHDNTSHGLYCDRSLNYATGTYTYEITVNGNTFDDNGGSGLYAEGCSLDIQNNTTTNNADYGMVVISKEKPDDTAGYSNPYDALSPNNVSDDLVSKPRITGNTFGGNADGGLWLVDTEPTNASTVVTGNTFNANSGVFRFKHDWYAAVEILTSSGTPVTSGSETVSMTPSNTACTTRTGSTVASAGGSNAIWGGSSVDYNNAATWFVVTESTVDSNGTTQECGTYSVRALGDYTDTTATSYTADATNNDTASTGGLPNGLSSSGLYRYQIAEVVAVTDADSDGLTNATEITLSTNSRDSDSDDDGISDATETNNGSAVDTDSDGTIDALDTDSDGDTRGDTTEGIGDYDADSIPNYRDTTNGAPSTPSNTSPSSGATGVDTAPTLTTSTFSDPESDGHGKTKWKIYTSQTGCTERTLNGVVDTTSTTNLTSYAVPSGSLQYNTTYWWTAAYVDNFAQEATSSYSTCTSFTTTEDPTPDEEDDDDDSTDESDGNGDNDTDDNTDGDDENSDDTIEPPTFSGALPNLTFDEDSDGSFVFDLDQYFSSSDALTYVANLSLSAAVSVDINDGEVTITPWQNSYGIFTTSFTATDSAGQTATSNDVTITINGINDPPGTVTGGFSPASGEVTSATSITISWFDAWDDEDSEDTLSYDIVFGSGDNPFSNTLYTATLTDGATSISIPITLENLNTYSYSIETIDSAGERSGWSALQGFTVDQQLKPALSLTKTIKKIKSDEELRLEQIEAAINNALPRAYARRVSHIARTSSSVVLFILTLLLVGAMVVMHSPHFLLALGRRNPASPFTAMAQRNAGGTYAMSYSQFTGRVHLMRQALVVCGVVAILFLIISYVAEASEEETVVHPGSTVVVAVTYTNTGTGPATNVVINDRIPDHTVVLEERSTLRIGDIKEELRDTDGTVDNTLQFDIGSVAVGASGTVTYRVVADDRLEEESMEFAAATATANELNAEQPVLSNSVSVPVVSATGMVSVKTRDQQPLQNVTVRVYAESITDEHLVTTLSTDEQGIATIEHVPAGGYILAVETPTAYNPVSPHTIALSYETEASAAIVVTRQGEDGDDSSEGAPEQQNIPFEDAVILNTLPALTTAQTAWTAEQSQLMQSAMVDALQNTTVPLQIESTQGVPLTREDTAAGTLFTFNEQYGVRDLLERWTQGVEQVVAQGTVVTQGTVALPGEVPLPTGGSDSEGMVMRVSILPDIIVQTARYDTAQKIWTVNIPADTLQPGVAHVVYGELSSNGQSSGVVELERFTIRENVTVPLATVLMLLNWLVLAGLLIYVIGYMVISPLRSRRTKPSAGTIDTGSKNQ